LIEHKTARYKGYICDCLNPPLGLETRIAEKNIKDNTQSNRGNTMEKHALKIVNNCLIINIYSYLETSGGQSSNLYLNVAHIFNIGDN
jgi:hypothetical protein